MAAMSNDAIRQQAADVLQGKEFQQYVPKEEPFNVLDWLSKHLNWKFPFEEMAVSDQSAVVLGLVLKALFYLLIALVIGLMIHFLYQRFFKASPDDLSELHISQAQRQEAQASYAQLANEALQRQDYRQAIHYLFLATVSLVIRDAYFHGSEFLTNREIAQITDFSTFAQHRRLSELFQDMVFFDEPRWFGTFPASSEDYNHFKEIYTSFAHQVKGRADA